MFLGEGAHEHEVLGHLQFLGQVLHAPRIEPPLAGLVVDSHLWVEFPNHPQVLMDAQVDVGVIVGVETEDQDILAIFIPVAVIKGLDQPTQPSQAHKTTTRTLAMS